jgi:protein ImuB
MLRLLRERLGALGETLDAECGFEAMRLDAAETAPVLLHATDLAPAAARDAEAEARLADMLRARLGEGAVGTLAIQDSHMPDQRSPDAAQRRSGAQARPSPGHQERAEERACDAPQDGVMRRPLTLFARAQPIDAMATVPDGPPVRFRWRRVLREVVRAEGPERIAPNWLSAPHARTRDYYRVEDKEGRRYWLYRDGLYDEAKPPRWYVHGVFA